MDHGALIIGGVKKAFKNLYADLWSDPNEFKETIKQWTDEDLATVYNKISMAFILEDAQGNRLNDRGLTLREYINENIRHISTMGHLVQNISENCHTIQQETQKELDARSEHREGMKFLQKKIRHTMIILRDALARKYGLTIEDPVLLRALNQEQDRLIANMETAFDGIKRRLTQVTAQNAKFPVEQIAKDTDNVYLQMRN